MRLNGTSQYVFIQLLWCVYVSGTNSKIEMKGEMMLKSNKDPTLKPDVDLTLKSNQCLFPKDSNS